MIETKPEFFKMSFDPGEPNSPTCTDYAPKGIDRYLAKMGVSVSYWPPDMTFFCDQGYADDYLCNPLGWFLFSERVQAILNQIAAKDIEFLPARVIELGTGKELKGYRVMNIVRICDAFDRDRSIWLPFKRDRTEPSGTKKLAIDKDKVGDAKIFRLADQPYNNPIITRTVKERLEAVGATGFWFIPLLS